MKRSRRRIQSTGKRVVPTQLSFKIFDVLQDYYYLNTKHLYGHIGGNLIYLKAHLKNLTHEANTPHKGQYLTRPERRIYHPNFNNTPEVYENAPAAYTWLKEIGHYDELAYKITHLGRRSAHSEYPHEVYADELLSSLHMGAKAQGFDFIHASRILRNAPEAAAAPSPLLFSLKDGKRLTPDRIFGLKSPNTDFKFFALEADMGTMPISRSGGGSSIMQKVDYYQMLYDARLYETHLYLPNMLVLFVTKNREHMLNIIDYLAEKNVKPSWLLFGSAHEYVDPFKVPPPIPRLFTDPWKRVGHPDFFLFQK